MSSRRWNYEGRVLNIFSASSDLRLPRRDVLVQELREELDKSASAHAKQARNMDFDYRNRIGTT